MEKSSLSIDSQELEIIVWKAVVGAFKAFHYQPPENVPKEDIELVPLKEAACFLNLTTPVITELAKSESIPHYRIGRKLYFKKLELFEWLESSKKEVAHG